MDERDKRYLKKMMKGPFDYVELDPSIVDNIDSARRFENSGLMTRGESVDYIDSRLLGNLPSNQSSIIRRIDTNFVDNLYLLLEDGMRRIVVCRSKDDKRYIFGFRENKAA